MLHRAAHGGRGRLDLTPRARKLLADARVRLQAVDPGRDDPGLTDLRHVLELVLEAMEENDGTMFTAKVLQSGLVTIPNEIRATKGIVAGQYATLDFVSVQDAPLTPPQG